MREKKFFTVDEANGLLPQLTALIVELRQSRQRLLSQRPSAERVTQTARGNGGGGEASAYLSEYSGTFNRGLARFATLGVLLKDLDRGLLDFPYVREGREVYLCWEFGEKQIAFWHETDSGYGSRQPL